MTAPSGTEMHDDEVEIDETVVRLLLAANSFPTGAVACQSSPRTGEAEMGPEPAEEKES
jgi:hypothetical protein